MRPYINEDGYLVLDDISTGVKLVSEKHYRKLVAQIEALKEENEVLKEENEVLKEENESLQKSNSSLTDQLELANAKVVLGKDTQDKLEKEIDSLDDNIAYQQEIIANLSQQSHMFEGQIRLLEKQLKEKEAIISSFDTLLGAVVALYNQDTSTAINAGFWQGLYEMRHSLFAKNQDDFNKKFSSILNENKVLAKKTADLCSDTKDAVTDNVNILIQKFKQDRTLG